MKHVFQIEVDIPDSWLNYVAPLFNSEEHNLDEVEFGQIFSLSSIGYWLRPIKQSYRMGALAYDYGDGDHRPTDEEVEEADRCWRDALSLPPNWYEINRAVAMSAYMEGVKRWGLDWMEKADGRRFDAVIQLALFSRFKYG